MNGEPPLIREARIFALCMAWFITGCAIFGYILAFTMEPDAIAMALAATLVAPLPWVVHDVVRRHH